MVCKSKTFNVGDKVRVVEAPTYIDSKRFIGKQLVVRKVEGDLEGGNVYFEGFDDSFKDSVLGDYLELVESATPKLTKKRRIEALEKDVARQETELEELRAKVEAMMQDRATRTALTPNQRRAQIIADAKGFVEQTVELVSTVNVTKGKLPSLVAKHGHIRVKFVVNSEKRTVVALAYYRHVEGGVLSKAIAKCAPDDIFNADIDKAIAIGRLFGLDVERFINAPKPDKKAVGQLIEIEGNFRPYVDKVISGDSGSFHDVAHPKSPIAILDDTEAQYE